MRRLICLVLLVCLGPVQAFGANCPAATAEARASAVHDAHSSHEHHGADSSSEQPGHHFGDCGMMVSCGSALLVVPPLRAPAPALTAGLNSVFAPSFYSSPSPHFDPPPPRFLK